MGEHYYSNNPVTKSHEQKHQVFVNDNLTLALWTDHGVFSKTGLDFGSRLLINSVLSLSLPNQKLLDVGCGYGPIGISLAKLIKESTVTMIDVNERAVILAHKNSELNHVDATVFTSDIYANVTDTDYGLIVSNPPIRAGKEVVHHIIEKAYHHLAPSGKLAIVIQKKQGAPSAQKKMQTVFGNVDLINRDKGYWILCSTKVSD